MNGCHQALNCHHGQDVPWHRVRMVEVATSFISRCWGPAGGCTTYRHTHTTHTHHPHPLLCPNCPCGSQPNDHWATLSCLRHQAANLQSEHSDKINKRVISTWMNLMSPLNHKSLWPYCIFTNTPYWLRRTNFPHLYRSQNKKHGLILKGWQTDSVWNVVQ